jgi:hypothetical protein
MKRQIYTGVRQSRFLFTPLSVVIIFLPIVTLFCVMLWGDGFLVPFWCSLAGAVALYFITTKVITVKQRNSIGDDAAIARWTYDKAFWREYRQQEFHPA